MHMIRWIAFAVVAAAAGCTTSSGGDLELAGGWTGAAGSGATISMSLTTDGDAVSGAATIDPGSNTGGPAAGTVIGSRSGKDGEFVSLTITTSHYSVGFDGIFTDATDLDGNLNGWDWQDAEIHFTR